MKLFDKKWKWILFILIIIISGFLLYRYFFYTCCALPSKLIPNSNGSLLYSARTTIGLCRTKQGEGGTCYLKTSLYFPGKLVIERSEAVMDLDGEKIATYPTIEKTLNKDSMNRIIKQIRDSGVMTKSCEAEPVMDLYVSYFINLDGVRREIRFPGCEVELSEIDKLINAAADK